MAREIKSRKKELLPDEIYQITEHMLADEISRDIEDWILDSYSSLKHVIAKLKPTKKEYEYLKEDDNWALYDSFSDYPKEYVDMAYDAARDALNESKNEEGSTIDFSENLVEDGRFDDAAANIAVDIIVRALEDIRKNKKV